MSGTKELSSEIVGGGGIKVIPAGSAFNAAWSARAYASSASTSVLCDRAPKSGRAGVATGATTAAELFRGDATGLADGLGLDGGAAMPGNAIPPATIAPPPLTSSVLDSPGAEMPSSTIFSIPARTFPCFPLTVLFALVKCCVAGFKVNPAPKATGFPDTAGFGLAAGFGFRAGFGLAAGFGFAAGFGRGHPASESRRAASVEGGGGGANESSLSLLFSVLFDDDAEEVEENAAAVAEEAADDLAWTDLRNCDLKSPTGSAGLLVVASANFSPKAYDLRVESGIFFSLTSKIPVNIPPGPEVTGLCFAAPVPPTALFFSFTFPIPASIPPNPPEPAPTPLLLLLLLGGGGDFTKLLCGAPGGGGGGGAGEEAMWPSLVECDAISAYDDGRAGSALIGGGGGGGGGGAAAAGTMVMWGGGGVGDSVEEELEAEARK